MTNKDNEFVIEDNGYGNIFRKIHQKTKENLVLVARAKEEAMAQDIVIIDPTLTDDEIIDRAWDQYNAYTKPFRRRANWITLEYFGLTNQQIYDYLKHSLYDNIYTPDAVYTDGNCGTSDDPINLTEGQYEPLSQRVEDIDNALMTIENIDHKMEMADEYAKDTGYVLLIPALIPNLDILEKYWTGYTTMVMRHQRLADMKTMELFGLTNEQIYIAMKRKFLASNQDYINDDNDPNIELYVSESRIIENYFDKAITKDDFSNKELAKGLMNFASDRDFVSSMACKKIIPNQIDRFDGLTNNIPSNTWDYTDLPAYTPDELIDDGIYSGGINPEGPNPNDDMVTGNILAEDWFREYCNFITFGAQSESYRELNKSRIHKLATLFTETNRDFAWRRSVKQLGWNPDVPFTPNFRAANDILARNILRRNFTEFYDFVDISDAESAQSFQESNKNSSKDRRPIYIVLFSGDNVFSKAIKTYTNSEYSHAMISLDSSFKRCYSYGIEGAKSSFGGFIIEDLTKKPKDALCKIYATIVDSEVYHTIEKNIDWFIRMQKKTRYGFMNIITYLFRIPMQRNTNMICSQFVDRMIKLGHIDFTKKASSLLSPADIDRAARKNKKIYTIYKGLAYKVNQFVIDRKVDNIFAKNKVLESADFCTYKKLALTNETAGYVYDKLLRPIEEVKDLPIRITNNGDVLVKNFKKVDYESEFAKSHKLLVEYEKQNNIEGMKSELAHMWSYLLQIEEKLYGVKSIPQSQRKDLFKVRAKIIGDFKKYMNVVLRSDSNFDFGQYYEESPYSNNTYRVTGSTINGLLKIIKTIVR